MNTTTIAPAPPPSGILGAPPAPILPPDHPRAPDLPRNPSIDPLSDTPAPVQEPPRPPEADQPAIRT